MTNYKTLLIKQQGSVAWVNLNRPKARNAMNKQMIEDLLNYFQSIQDNRNIRVVVLGATGTTFCAGGDIKEMQATLNDNRKTHLMRVEVLDTLLDTINKSPQVVIARIQGPAMGGGVGLICVTDMAVSAQEAPLALPEVRLGLVPAVISPYVVARVGLGKARQLMLTGMRLKGQAALDVGLVTHTCPLADLDNCLNDLINRVLQASPNALAACKALLFEVANKTTAQTTEYRVDLLNKLRSSSEGMEGMMAFVQKRPPSWVETV